MRRGSISFFKVAILGANGGIGQPLSLLMKMNPLVSELRVFDVKGALGVAADLSHVSTPCKVKGYTQDNISEALVNADLVLIPAGMPRKPGMSRDDLFNTNAAIAQELTIEVGKNSPTAVIGIITNPVNSTIPIAAEALKKLGVYDPRKLFGVTTLDTVRACTFVGEALGRSPCDMDIPVIGGHSGETIVPILSAYSSLSEEKVKQLTHRIQFGGDEVVNAKAGAGSATLSMAYAGAHWASSVLKALRGDKGITICTFVESPVKPPLRFFSSPVELGKNGVERFLPLPKLNSYEESLLAKCTSQLELNIKKGSEFQGSKVV